MSIKNLPLLLLISDSKIKNIKIKCSRNIF
uniref:Uncharacterized protein n=1 Tax=Heterorhabditis bacteriophora TaxID=37862 RepID=A0A1I7W6N7_HETBA